MQKLYVQLKKALVPFLSINLSAIPDQESQEASGQGYQNLNMKTWILTMNMNAKGLKFILIRV
ncbi:hypothetical protein [Desulfosporosinus fructosivorans]